MKPRVFVSSLMNDFKEYRQAAREAIKESDADPVLVEDFPSISTSPRNACLDGVRSCDILICIIGNQGGFKSPSGKFVVEEEFEEANRLQMPILLFLEEIERDSETEIFVAGLSNYIDGLFRLTFNSADILKSGITKSLQPLVENFPKPRTNMTIFEDKLSQKSEYGQETYLRSLLVPERDEEIIKITDLEDEGFIENIYQIAHHHNVKLFSYEHSKEKTIELDSIIINQIDRHGYRANGNVKLEINTHGTVLIETCVNDPSSSRDIGDLYCIVEKGLIELLRRIFKFTEMFFEEYDKFKKHQNFLYNSFLGSINMKTIVSELPRRRDNVNIGSPNDVIAYDKPKMISRRTLINPDEIIRESVTYFKRRASIR